MGNPFEDLRQAVVVRPMNSPGPQGAAAPHMKIRYSADSVSWHNDPVETDKYLSFSTDNGITWSDAIYFNNLSETLDWVEKARQWAENPENVPVEAGKYSALHHATRAARSEFNAEAAALDAAGSAAKAFGAAAPAWDSETVYNYNDVVSFDNGHTYRCVGINVVGEDHAPNFNGADNEAEWTRITVAPDGFFEVDENGDYMPKITPVISEIFMLDENGDIMPQEYIDLEPGIGIGVESQGKIEFVDSIEEFRASSFVSAIEGVYVNGYYGAGTPGGGMFYRDPESIEADNSGTIIVDGDGIRWKRANVYEKYYASWFGVSVDIDDNSPLIQNALNIIPSGSILIFGPGTFRCKQTIKIPDHPTVSDRVKTLIIQGSTNVSTDSGGGVELRYTGPNPSVLTPFIDFRGSTFNKRYGGAIRNINFSGPGKDSNIIGLWMYHIWGDLFDNVGISDFKYGMQIDGHYYCCQFVHMWYHSCDYGIRALSLANGTALTYCRFNGCNVGFGHNLNQEPCTGIYFNYCYFETNDTAIKTSMWGLLNINQCYFEDNRYILDVYITNIYTISPIIIIENSFLMINDYSSTLIKQNILENINLTLILNNNLLSNSNINYQDPFIYIESGNIIIKAENNKMYSKLYNFPICSKTPLKTSYFNNDFSDTD